VQTVTIDAPLCTDGVLTDVADPRLSDVAVGDASALMPPGGGACLDLVVCMPGPGLLGSTTPGSLGAADLGVIKLGLQGY
jgi:hypothetical protein